MNKTKSVPPSQLTPLTRALRLALGSTLFSLTALSSLAQAADTFTGLDDLVGGSFYSLAYGVSADGAVVVGQSNGTSGYEAFRWTQAGGMVGLGDLAGGGFNSQANGVSADGAVVVGVSSSTYGNEAFRWTQAGGMVGLGDLAGGFFFSSASGVSADGAVVVGRSRSTSGYEAFLWTQAGGMVGLGDLAGGSFDSSANGVSADGAVVVGRGDGASGTEAFRWTQAGGMVGLGDLAGGGFDSSATGVSADGAVVVGYGSNAIGTEAFRWTQTGGMVGLGDLAGGFFYSRANGVSADGAVVVGQSNGTSGYEAFRWTQAGGMVTVTSWLGVAGVTVTPGYTMFDASGVSADGSVVVGRAYGPSGTEAYLARVSVIGSGIINPAVFNQSVMETGSRAVQAGVGLPALVLFGAHHRSILDSGLARSANGACAWATGDIARQNGSDTRMGLAEVGACKDLDTARIGLGIGHAYAKQDWSFGGEAKYNGEYLIAEAANAFANGIQPSLTAYYGRFGTTLNRNYQNGANIDTSRGTPDATSKAVRVRVDWKDITQLGNVSISPYAAYTWMRTSVDGYTEAGGGFPVRFDSNSWDTNDIRIGTAGLLSLNTATDLRVGAEAVHRFEGSNSGSSGQILGLSSFAVKGESIKQNWVRVTADVDHRFTDNMLMTVGVNAGGNGGDANWGLTTGLKASF
jgi:probable HAF family extracellular repeat protein